MSQAVLDNVLANIITTILFTVLGLISFTLIVLYERNILLQFFGITKDRPRLRIYLSRLEIKPGGTEGIEPVTTGYTGPAISKMEYDVALLVVSQFQSRLLALIPKTIREWFSQRYVSIMPINPPIDVSPKNIDDVPHDNLLIVGGTIYNVMTKYYLELPSSCFSFIRDANSERVIKLRRGGLTGTTIPGRQADRELAIIHRLNDIRCNRTVIICAGLGSSATYGSVRYLAENWRELHRRYKKSDFSIWLAFKGQPPDGALVIQPSVVEHVAG